MATPFSAAPSAATEHAGKVPVIGIAFKNGMWWVLPQGMSQAFYDKYLANEQILGTLGIGATHGVARGSPTMKRQP